MSKSSLQNRKTFGQNIAKLSSNDPSINQFIVTIWKVDYISTAVLFYSRKLQSHKMNLENVDGSFASADLLHCIEIEHRSREYEITTQ